MIYFIQAEQTKKIKIGFTTKWVEKRMSSMRSESPDTLVFLGGVAGSRLEEKRLHKQFSHLHSHGEWFYESLEIVEFINSLPLKNERSFDILSERLEKGELSVEEANLLTNDDILKDSSERLTKALNNLYKTVSPLGIKI